MLGCLLDVNNSNQQGTANFCNNVFLGVELATVILDGIIGVFYVSDPDLVGSRNGTMTSPEVGQDPLSKSYNEK
jgi:hypothetical protein